MTTAAVLRRSLKSWWSPDFRREGPPVLQLLWTGLFAVVIALAFTLMGFVFYAPAETWANPSAWWFWFQPNLLVAAVIAYTMHALFELGWRLVGRERLARSAPARRALFFAGVPILGIAVGWPLAVRIAGFRFSWLEGGSGVAINAGMVLISALLSLVAYLVFRSRARVAEAERRETEARLKLLQAQIEPHFLFNTLANVQCLIDSDADRAKRMLEDFVDYLRASLGRLRSEQTTLGAELDMADAYLRLMQLRMDDRLAFRIEADAALREVPVPPLLLQPLVENAIHHGVEPRLAGGEVVVTVRREGDAVAVIVEDRGDGPAAACRASRRGNGIAMANIRERLAARYAGAAELRLEPQPQGMRARLTLPSPATPRQAPQPSAEARRAAALAPCERRRADAPDRRGRRAFLPGRRKVHRGAHRGRRAPDPHADHRAGGLPRSRPLLAGAPLDDRQSHASRRHTARRREQALAAHPGPSGRVAGEPGVRASVQGDVTRRRAGILPSPGARPTSPSSSPAAATSRCPSASTTPLPTAPRIRAGTTPPPAAISTSRPAKRRSASSFRCCGIWRCGERPSRPASRTRSRRRRRRSPSMRPAPRRRRLV